MFLCRSRRPTKFGSPTQNGFFEFGATSLGSISCTATMTETEVYATQVDHDQVQEPEERVVLNVGGTRYEVLPSTLTRYPNTLLGSLFDSKNINRMKPDKKGEYFFDRNAKVFDIILNFYRTGKLVVPTDLPYDLVREELNYFKLEWDDPNADEEDEDVTIRSQPKEKQIEIAVNFVHQNKRKDIKRGITLITELLSLEPENIDLLYYRAFGLYRVNDLTKAMKDLDAIVAIDPDNTREKSLRVLFEDSKIATIQLGVALLGVAIAGVAGFLKLKNVW